MRDSFAFRSITSETFFSLSDTSSDASDDDEQYNDLENKIRQKMNALTITKALKDLYWNNQFDWTRFKPNYPENITIGDQLISLASLDEKGKKLYKEYYSKTHYDELEIEHRAKSIVEDYEEKSFHPVLGSSSTTDDQGVEVKKYTYDLGLYIIKDYVMNPPYLVYEAFPYNRPAPDGSREPFALPRDYKHIDDFMEIKTKYPKLEVFTILLNPPSSSSKMKPLIDIFTLPREKSITTEYISDLRNLFKMRTFVFCYKKSGLLVLAPYSDPWRNVLKHINLCYFKEEKSNVVCAGHMTIDDSGDIIVDRLSGTYQPSKKIMNELLSSLANKFPNNFFVLALKPVKDLNLKVFNRHPDRFF